MICSSNDPPQALLSPARSNSVSQASLDAASQQRGDQLRSNKQPDPPTSPASPAAARRQKQAVAEGTQGEKEAAAAALLWSQSPDIQTHVRHLCSTLDSTRLPGGSLITEETWLKG